jgi:DNA repair exonuclease SbcCD ATPase subunit
MLNIKSVTMRNFLSVGNVPQTLDLDGQSLTLILGENMDVGGVNSRNGVGKSTILQAISFGLFGIPLSNIKKDNLVNSINGKNMVVNISFEVNGKQFRIERGRKPQFFRYFINDTQLMEPETDEGQGEGKHTQVEINKILGFSHDMFRHIVAMNTYTEPFLKLRPGDQRVLIEELLGITQISLRSENLKELIKNTKDSIKEEEYRIKAAQDSNQKIHNTINDLTNKSNTWQNARHSRIASAESQLEELQNLNIDYEIDSHHKLADYRTLVGLLNQASKDLRRQEQDLVNKDTMLGRLASNLAHAEEHKCHTCGQEIHDAKHDKMIQDIKDQIIALEPELASAVADVEASYQYINELNAGLVTIGDEPRTVYQTLAQALEHKNTINNILESIFREESSVDPYAEQITTLSSTGLQPIDDEALVELNTLLKHQDFLLKLLVNKDSFIRKKIVDQNSNQLNHRLNYYLEKLGLPHEVTFKSDLSVEIDLMGRDFDFEQLSRGEMNRVILATSWAFRDVWESLNQNINLLFVDEYLDNGLDAQGADAALGLLKKMAAERQKSIFLISHKEDLIARVSNVLMVKKENGFTKFNAEGEK